MCSSTGSGREQGRRSAVANEGCGLRRRRRGSVRPYVRSGGADVGSRQARRPFFRRPSGGGPAGWRTRCPCGRYGDGFRAYGAIGAGGRSRIPCRHGAWRAPAAWAASEADGRDPAHERFPTEAVVRVGGGDTQGQGQSAPVGDQVDFRSLLAAVGRIRSGQWPPFAARMLMESIAHRDQSNSPRTPSSSRMTR